MSIEAGAGMKNESEKEWYHMTRERERLGPFSFQEVRPSTRHGQLYRPSTPAKGESHPPTLVVSLRAINNLVEAHATF